MNHAFVTTRKGDIDLDIVDATIQATAKGPFKGILTVKRDDDDKSWWVGHDDFPGVLIWPKTSRKLAFRQGACGDFTGWLQNLLQCEIAKAVKGRCSDEGVTEIWEPTESETPTWRSYFDLMFSHVPKTMANYLWKQTVKGLPDDLKKLAEPD